MVSSALKASLRNEILELGMEVDLPIPELVGGFESELAAHPSEPWETLAEILKELVVERKILIFKVRWDEGEQGDVGVAEAMTLLSERGRYFFGRDPNEERLHFINADNLVPDYVFPEDW